MFPSHDRRKEVTYHNGDSAFWDGSAWTRIPAQVMDDELNKLVSKTGDQTIAGVKTFSDSPVIPSAINNTEAQNKAGVESQITARQETVRSQSTTKSPTSKLMDDELNSIIKNYGSEAVQLLRLHNPSFIFQGFADSNTTTPAHGANKAWIVTESGTVFGKTVTKGQIIYSNGTIFIVESSPSKVSTFLPSNSNVLRAKITFDRINLKSKKSLGKNLYDPNSINLTQNSYISSSGAVVSLAGFTISEYIPILAGQTMTINRTIRA